MPHTNSFIVLPSYVEAISELPAKDRGELWRALIEYAVLGTAPTLKSAAHRALFAALKPSVDFNAERREKRSRSTNDTPTADQWRANGEPMADQRQTNGEPMADTPSKETGKRKEVKEEEKEITPKPPKEKAPAGSHQPAIVTPERVQEALSQTIPEKPVAAWFERLWRIYPKQIGRYRAEAALREASWEISEADVERMEAMIRERAASTDWQKDGGKWVPRLDRWLADKPWLDDPSSTTTTKQARRLSPQERAAIDELMGGETA